MCVVCHLSCEVSLDSDQVVQLGEDLPENLLVHLSSLPGVKVGGGTGVKGHITDHQRKAARGRGHPVRLE